jgi:hypothetical protein
MSDLGLFAQQHVYLGAWINWKRGRVLGATITMSQGNASLLIAFIALFVSFVGTRFFRLACFIAHRLYSKRSAQDGIYHQRQAILRNSDNAIGAIWSLGEVFWPNTTNDHLHSDMYFRIHGSGNFFLKHAVLDWK